MTAPTDPREPAQIARQLAARLAARTDLPKPADAALDRLDALLTRRPADADQEHRALIAAYAAGAKDTETNRLAAAEATAFRRTVAWSAACDEIGGDVLREIKRDRDRIIEDLRPAAVTCIDRLTAAAVLADRDISLYIRDGQVGEAKTLADAGSVLTEWTELVKLRDAVAQSRDLFGPRVEDHRDVRWWKDPTPMDPARKPGTVDVIDYVLFNIRGGGQLWWPTIDEAIEQASVLQARHDATEAKRRADRQSSSASTHIRTDEHRGAPVAMTG